MGKKIMFALAAPVSAFAFAFVLSSVVLLISGYNPLDAYGEMLSSAAKLESVIDMLNEATPLYLSAIAAAIGFRMNLFNIGVEGQFRLAAFASAVIGAKVALPAVFHILFIMIVAMVVGALFAGLAGLLKVKRGVNEVISTIMLNQIVILGIIAGLYKIFLYKPEGGSISNGTEPLAESAHLPDLNNLVEIFTREIIKGRRLTGMLLVAIFIGILYHLFMNRSVLGYGIRATGINPMAARVGGIPPKRMVMIAMMASGGVAGLVGMVDILSKQHAFNQSFVFGRGFDGIAIALLGRNHPAGMAGAALLFAFLKTSSGVLQVSGTASAEIVIIMQGAILLAAVVAYEAIGRVKKREEVREASEVTGAVA